MIDSRLARHGVSNDSQANSSTGGHGASSGDSLDQGLARLDRAIKRLAWLTTFGPPEQATPQSTTAAAAETRDGHSDMAGLEAELATLRAAYEKLQKEHRDLKSAYADLDAARKHAGQRLTAVINHYRAALESGGVADESLDAGDMAAADQGA